MTVGALTERPRPKGACRRMTVGALTERPRPKGANIKSAKRDTNIKEPP